MSKKKLLEELEKLKKIEEMQKISVYKQASKDFEMFCKLYVKIINKDGEKVPFILNDAQKYVNKVISKLKREGKPVRLIILKARQMGLSTLLQARLMWHTTTKTNRNALIIAHTDSSTSSIFEKAKLVYNNLPQVAQPLKRASNSKELIFDCPADYKGDEVGLNSRIVVESSGGTSIGRGSTSQYVHLSEFAFFEKDPKLTLAAILQSVPKNLDTEVFIESTANGLNFFKDLWDDSYHLMNQWTPIFLPWFKLPEYKLPLSKAEEEAWKIYKKTKVDNGVLNLDKNELELIDLYNLNYEQLKWRRFSLMNDCSGDLDMFNQENPSCPEIAFINSGRPVFELHKLTSHIQYIRKEGVTPKIGDIKFKDSKYEFSENKNGYIKFYEFPKKNEAYVIGADVAEGNENGDYDAAHVLEAKTMKQVAVLHGHMAVDKYAEELMRLGYFYNTAMLIPESNFNPGLILDLEKMRYPRMYIRQQMDSYLHKFKPKFGWRTDVASRNIMVANLVEYARDHIHLIQDIPTLQEMLKFIRNAKGRPEAQPGAHDDLVMALAIALQGCISGQMGTVKKQKEINYDKIIELPNDYLEDFYKMSPQEQFEFAKRHGFLD